MKRIPRLLAVASAVLLLCLAAFFAAAWYYADLLLDGGLKADYDAEKLDLRVLDLTQDSIVLAPASKGNDIPSLREPAMWGLEGESAYGRVGRVLSQAGDGVRREFQQVEGQLEAGDRVRFDSFVFRGDPFSAHGLSFQEVSIQGELGALPAWFVPAGSDTWTIYVHGWRSQRDEALRFLPIAVSMDSPALVVSYRNDEGAPRSPDRLIRFGETEWRDLEAAVLYAREHGARRLVLYGFSMGGAIVLSFLYQSQHADSVQAVVLDAPMLDFNAVIAYEAGKRNIPSPLTWAAKQLAAERFDLDWQAFDYLAGVGRLETPVLLFHGDADTRVPLHTSQLLASARPDLVTFVKTAGAGHVRSWNVDPISYERVLRAFLGRYLPVPATAFSPACVP